MWRRSVCGKSEQLFKLLLRRRLELTINLSFSACLHYIFEEEILYVEELILLVSANEFREIELYSLLLSFYHMRYMKMNISGIYCDVVSKNGNGSARRWVQVVDFLVSIQLFKEREKSIQWRSHSHVKRKWEKIPYYLRGFGLLDCIMNLQW